MSDETTRDLLDARFDQIVSLINKLTDNQAVTDARVERLERVLEERLYDTRPIWETVQVQMQELGRRVDGIESEMTGMRTEMSGLQKQNSEILGHMVKILTQMNEARVETANGFRGVNRRIALLGKTLIDMTVDFHQLQERVEKIESQPT